MTSILEKLITVIAPHRCVSCSKYNNILCEGCIDYITITRPQQCGYCRAISPTSQTCKQCQQYMPLAYVWTAAVYKDSIAQTVQALKFGRAQAAAASLAYAMVLSLPFLPPDVTIVPVPTSPRRVRQRGYDQALLLAKAVSARTERPVAQLLRRKTHTRQVGATRPQRFRQMQQAFTVVAPKVPGHILLIDDVMTTGATLAAAAFALQAAGTKVIWGSVAAYQIYSNTKSVRSR